MKQLAVSCSLLLLPLLTAGTSDAQVVRVGPGYVKAPFVRVHRNPDGSTYVRAPFTEVQRPGSADPTDPRGYRRRDRFAPPQPAVDPQQQLAVAWMNLQYALQRVNNGTAWRDYLRLPQELLVAGPVPRSIDARPLEDRLATCLHRYDQTSVNPEYWMIAGLPAFQQLHQQLRQYTDLMPQAPLPPDPPSVQPELLPLPQ